VDTVTYLAINLSPFSEIGDRNATLLSRIER